MNDAGQNRRDNRGDRREDEAEHVALGLMQGW